MAEPPAATVHTWPPASLIPTVTFVPAHKDDVLTGIRSRQDVPADLEAVAMQLLAYDREARYRIAELAAHDLMRCQALPRDGRGELVHLLDVRFPLARRQRPNSRPPGSGSPSEVRTLTEPSVPLGAPPFPRLEERATGKRRAAMLERARWRRRALAWGVLALVIAAAIALFVAR